MIAPIVSLSGSVVTAFDDVGIDDPDFRSIQGKNIGILLQPVIFSLMCRNLNVCLSIWQIVLAEAGVIPSKLSWNNSFDYGGFDTQQNINFFPDRYIFILSIYTTLSNFIFTELNICSL